MPEWEVRLNSKRKEIIKLMHYYIMEIGDEDVYYQWTRIGVPDGATEHEFTLICVDDDWFYECCEEFSKLVKHDK